MIFPSSGSSSLQMMWLKKPLMAGIDVRNCDTVSGGSTVIIISSQTYDSFSTACSIESFMYYINTYSIYNSIILTI
jgi:hypothetical protein